MEGEDGGTEGHEIKGNLRNQRQNQKPLGVVLSVGGVIETLYNLESKDGIYAVDVNEIAISSRTATAKPLIKKAKLTLKDIGLYLN